jgi:hypothetical protein
MLQQFRYFTPNEIAQAHRTIAGIQKIRKCFGNSTNLDHLKLLNQFTSYENARAIQFRWNEGA